MSFDGRFVKCGKWLLRRSGPSQGRSMTVSVRHVMSDNAVVNQVTGENTSKK